MHHKIGAATVVAIDPGRSTGVAIRLNGEYSTYTLQEHESLWNLLLAYKPEVVVYENFATSGNISSHGLHTVRLVGGIETLGYEHGWHVFKHIPQYRTPFQKQASERIKGLKHTASKKAEGVPITIHEHDAMAHLIAWETREEKRWIESNH